MQKHTLLKVISILFIVFGAMSLISSFGNFSGNALLGALGIVSSVVSVASAALQLGAGILGIQKADNLDLCKKLAIVLIVLAVLNGVLGIVLVSSFAGAMGVNAGASIAAGAVTGVLAMIFGLILPVLYLIGIKKSANA